MKRPAFSSRESEFLYAEKRKLVEITRSLVIFTKLSNNCVRPHTPTFFIKLFGTCFYTFCKTYKLLVKCAKKFGKKFKFSDLAPGHLTVN